MESSEGSMKVSINVKEMLIPLIVGMRVGVGEILELDLPKGSQINKACNLS